MEVIPVDWIDLPEAPFVAGVVRGEAVLINRSGRTLDSVALGCVQPHGNTVIVVGQLFAQDVKDGRFEPGGHVKGLLRSVNKIDYYVSLYARISPDLLKRCVAESKVAVIAAGRRPDYRWSAAGTAWSR